MPRTKFRSVRRSVARGKRSRKPKAESVADESSSSAKKIRLDESATSQTTPSCPRVPTGYRFQDVTILRQVISACAVCKVCLDGTLKLLQNPGGCGMAKTMVLQCSNGDCKACTELPTSQRVVRGKARFYDVNRRSTLAMRVIGKGRAALVKFCAVMNMPGPVATKSFNTHVKAIARVSQDVAESEMKKAAKEITQKKQKKHNGVQNQEVLDVAVSCDGTWARRGFQSLYGMVSAIEVDTHTGKVLDFEVKVRCVTSAVQRKIWTLTLMSMLNGLKLMVQSVRLILINQQKQWKLLEQLESGEDHWKNIIYVM